MQTEDTGYKPVRSKWDFVSRYNANEFGNRTRTWPTLTEYLDDPPRDDARIHLRNRKVAADSPYNIPAPEVPARWKAMLEKGYNAQDIYLSEMAPPELTTFQGEATVYAGVAGMRLHYSLAPLPMRDALSNHPLWCAGSTAVALLRHYMNPLSFDWFEVLRERYPGHVIEFSCYTKELGVFPGFNTCFWEVRSY